MLQVHKVKRNNIFSFNLFHSKTNECLWLTTRFCRLKSIITTFDENMFNENCLLSYLSIRFASVRLTFYKRWCYTEPTHCFWYTLTVSCVLKMQRQLFSWWHVWFSIKKHKPATVSFHVKGQSEVLTAVSSYMCY